MNKKVFVFLVILMGISIAGIIAVQLVWLHNAVKVKNELFDRSVNEALGNTVSRLEKIRNLNLVHNFVFTDTLLMLEKPLPRQGLKIPPQLIVQKKQGKASKHSNSQITVARNPMSNSGEKIIKIHISNSNNSKNQLHSYTYSTTDTGFVKRKANSISIVTTDQNYTLNLNADSLISVGTARIDSIMSQMDTFDIHNQEIKKRIELKAHNLKTFTGDYIHEIAFFDVKRYDKSLIDSILSLELHDKDIPLDYQLGVLKNDSLCETVPEKPDTLKLIHSGFRVELFPHEILQQNTKLAIFFPGRESFIYRSLSWLLLSSLIFSFVILFTFALSIYYLLRQKKISEMKSDFINNMTHEFKTPIATISVAADSITNDRIVNDPEKIKYFAGMIKKENSRMNRQVEDILTIARLEKKDIEFCWEKIDIHELVYDAIQGIGLQIEKKGGKIVTQLDASMPEVVTDKVHFTNVLINLLDNAVKYSPAEPEITISTGNTKEGILISVDDKGIGMTKAAQAKVFERFYRQSTGNIHNVKGFGLGLSYSKAVVEANKGNISVQSEPGKGSRFTIFLPYERTLQ